MLAHHLVTLLLVFISYSAFYHRFGLCIFFLHDLVDVFLYIAKAFHDANIETAANISFMLFTITLFVFRIVIFFKYYILLSFNSAFYEVTKKYGFPDFRYEEMASMFEMNFGRTCFFKYCINPYNLCQILIVILYFLHIYWFYRTLLVLYDTLNAGSFTGDPRYIEEENKKKK
jgi:hypothetical protein